MNLLFSSVLQSQLEGERNKEQARNLRKQLFDVENRMKSMQKDSEVSADQRIRMTNTVDALNSELRELEIKKRHLHVQVEGMKSKKDFNLVKFGSYMPNLVEAINDAHRKNQFQRKPIGPCGVY